MKYLNFVGILILVGLSVVQWRNNRRANLLAGALERTRLEQTDTIAQQQQAITKLTSDLEEFRTRLTQAGTELTDLRKQVTRATADRDTMKIRNEQLQANLTASETNLQQWRTAVTQRDQVIAEASEEIRQAAGQRDEAIARFNALAKRYNEFVKPTTHATE